MQPRLIRTILLLSVLVTFAAGCAQQPSADVERPSPEPTNLTAEEIIGILAHPLPPAGAGATRGIRPTVPLYIAFRTGSAEMTPEAELTLAELARALKNPALVNARFRIEGHTDTVGTTAANKALSARRAASVVAYLTTRAGIDQRRLEAIGMGADALLVPTPDQTPEPRNRRVQVVKISG